MQLKNIIMAAAAILMLAGTTSAADNVKPSAMRGDKDGSATLSPMEITEERNTYFMSIDGDKNGKIKIQEFIDSLKKDFAARDTDKDGVLIADEFVMYWCGKAADPGAVKKGAAKPSKKRVNMFKQQDRNANSSVEPDECVVFWSMNFGAADANKDGKLTLDEFTKVIKQAAKRIDTNKDGIITFEEYKVYWSGTTKAAKPKKATGSK